VSVNLSVCECVWWRKYQNMVVEWVDEWVGLSFYFRLGLSSALESMGTAHTQKSQGGSIEVKKEKRKRYSVQASQLVCPFSPFLSNHLPARKIYGLHHLQTYKMAHQLLLFFSWVHLEYVTKCSITLCSTWFQKSKDFRWVNIHRFWGCLEFYEKIEELTRLSWVETE